jgi:hypothetical protein
MNEPWLAKGCIVVSTRSTKFDIDLSEESPHCAWDRDDFTSFIMICAASSQMYFGKRKNKDEHEEK